MVVLKIMVFLRFQLSYDGVGLNCPIYIPGELSEKEIDFLLLSI